MPALVEIKCFPENTREGLAAAGGGVRESGDTLGWVVRVVMRQQPKCILYVARERFKMSNLQRGDNVLAPSVCSPYRSSYFARSATVEVNLVGMVNCICCRNLEGAICDFAKSCEWMQSFLSLAMWRAISSQIGRPAQRVVL